MAVSLKFDGDGNIVSAAAAVFQKMKAKPIKRMGHLGWCKDKDALGSYPEDGQCSCGMYKHHVHCVCGGIVQVG